MKFNIDYSHKDKIHVIGNKAHVSIVTIDDSRNPAKWIPLIFDTGAFITIINKDFANANGYQVYQPKACIIAGFSEKGMVCDLRKIPTVVFCGFRINNVLIATPHEDDVPVADVLGMNIIENFNVGLNFTEEEIYISIRDNFISQKPKYRCGDVSVFNDVTEKGRQT